jgi:2-polyprenyl-6-methoxyphenol hydroxylase-like FAD-dependent oxidoreductase
MNRHAEIAGAGIAGLTAAAALAQRGWSVVVHERNTEMRAYGAGIYIWENGLRVLEAIGAFDEATSGATPAVERETRDETGALIGTARFSQERGSRLFAIVRQQLMNALRNAAEKAGVEIRTGSAAIAARPDGTLILAGGEERPADLVIGADGINSPIRESLALLRVRKPLPDGSIRFMIPRRPEELDTPEGNKFFEYWSGTRRLLYVPCSQDQVYIALTALDSDAAAKALPVRKDVWKASFPLLGPIIDRFGEEGRWDRFEVIKVSRWSRGRAAIIGDAAYAQAPNLGQGGGCAMMAALALAENLRDVSPATSGGLEAALARWEQSERELIDHCQRFSSFYGKLATWPPALRVKALDLMHRWPWLNRQRLRTAQHVPTGAAQ